MVGAVAFGACFASTLVYLCLGGWVGGIIGFASGGYVFQHVGYPNGFLLGAGVTAIGLLTLVPMGLILRARRKGPWPIHRPTPGHATTGTKEVP